MVKKKRVQVAFSETQWEIISELRNEFGDNDSDIIKNIVMAWLSEKSIISTNYKNRIISKNEES